MAADRNPLQLRPIDAATAPLAASVAGAVLESEGVTLSPREASELRALPAGYDGAHGQFWIYDADGAAVGTVAIRRADAERWEMRWLCLVPAWRGAGMGRFMAETALDFARRHGAASVEIALPAENAAARALLDSLGFEEIPESTPPRLRLAPLA